MKKKAHELEDTLVMNALALDGTCSGEHGVGIHKLVLNLHLSADLGIRAIGIRRHSLNVNESNKSRH